MSRMHRCVSPRDSREDPSHTERVKINSGGQECSPHTNTVPARRRAGCGKSVCGFRFREKDDPTSDEAPADSQKEKLGLSARLLHDPRIVAVFDFRFLKHEFHSNLRFVSSLDEPPGTLGKSEVSILSCFRFRRGIAGFGLALVLAKLHRGQAEKACRVW